MSGASNNNGNEGPPEPEVVLKWSHVNKFVNTRPVNSCTLPTTTQRKQLLCDCGGELKVGTITGLMGLSGSGKSTLLNTLACREVESPSTYTGQIYLNGRLLTPSHRKLVRYVPQADIYWNQLTIREHLMYVAQLRIASPAVTVQPAPMPAPNIDSNVSDISSVFNYSWSFISSSGVNSRSISGSRSVCENKIEQERLAELYRSSCVTSVLDQLCLAHVAETAIMYLSGGEKKRVSVATELLDHCNSCHTVAQESKVLLLDEATSGLDSYSSAVLMQALTALVAPAAAGKGRSAATTRREVLGKGDRNKRTGNSGIGRVEPIDGDANTEGDCIECESEGADTQGDDLEMGRRSCIGGNEDRGKDRDNDANTCSRNCEETLEELEEPEQPAQAWCVAMSIHQPSIPLFYSFDAIIFLTDGRVAYFGPPAELMGYLNGLGYHNSYYRADNVFNNPAEYMLNLLYCTEQYDYSTPALVKMVGSDTAEEIGVASAPSSSPQSLSNSTATNVSLTAGPKTATPVSSSILDNSSPALDKPTSSAACTGTTASSVPTGASADIASMDSSSAGGAGAGAVGVTIDLNPKVMRPRDHLVLVWREHGLRLHSKCDNGTGSGTTDCFNSDYNDGYSGGGGSAAADMNNGDDISSFSYVESQGSSWSSVVRGNCDLVPSEGNTNKTGTINGRSGDGGVIGNGHDYQHGDVNASGHIGNHNTPKTPKTPRPPSREQSFGIGFAASFRHSSRSFNSKTGDINNGGSSITGSNCSNNASNDDNTGLSIRSFRLGVMKGHAYQPLPVSKYARSYSDQYAVLTHRLARVMRPVYINWRVLGQTVVISLVAGLCWQDMAFTESKVFDISGLGFFTLSYWFFESVFHGVTELQIDRLLVCKERASGSYHISAYFFARMTASLGYKLLYPSLFFVIVYAMTMTNTGDATSAGMAEAAAKFFSLFAVLLLTAITADAIGLLVGCLLTGLDEALSLVTVITICMLLFGGFYIQHLPYYVNWLSVLSPFRYGYNAWLLIEFSSVDVVCDGGFLFAACATGNTYAYSSATAVAVVPKDVLFKVLGVTGSLVLNVGSLVVYCVVSLVISYIALRFRKVSTLYVF